ncbi:ligase-associated DNA damage response exonuclease [Stagnihabitans tardus]|uniref:Ligase-associated DNA damage response exonuclease n=1 Tax=Stagnihabitans tardus TaxID=2699202 RepID=A0AAE4Y882_9RHOB|nr:ligase-associated DNA damage response exonuclease [Stagnihabitans tardus]NBZ87024.1 ligase-associated DNA damage response exonuclease [Stagnihabitans tardus]
MDLIERRPEGLYCPAGDFWIDPMRAVPRALVTHGHSDHAARGMGAYLCTTGTLPVIRHRLGKITAEAMAYGERRQIGAVTVSFHPAGHVPGSAQIRVERGGEVWVAAGDYKVEGDALCEAFEPVPCDTFLTETTFGLPIFTWAPEAEVLTAMRDWWAGNAAEGVTSVVLAYSFGKAQRILAGLAGLDLPGPLACHPTVEAVTEVLRAAGYALPATGEVSPGALVIATPQGMASDWALSLGLHRVAAASGWMALAARRKGVDRAFVLSDHADFPGLNAAVEATGAGRVICLHGYREAFALWLRGRGYEAEAW